MPVDKVLIVMVGLPRSGKSTWAMERPYPIVNPDSIRLALHGQPFYGPAEPLVWAHARLMVRSLFLAGHQRVVLDATNTTRKRRDEWQSKEWAAFFKPIHMDIETCLERADGNPGLQEAIRKMSDQWEPIAADEMVWPN